VDIAPRKQGDFLGTEKSLAPLDARAALKLQLFVSREFISASKRYVGIEDQELIN
jgi:hypothetical protein|tara:strand:+ start:259 stop:423 length:165 start_codon:yes stop_codon:yes gene_type:complete